MRAGIFPGCGKVPVFGALAGPGVALLLEWTRSRSFTFTMRRAFENSCIKGCAIYLAVLVIILVASAAGLGGLRARFGASAPSVQSSGAVSQASGSAAPQEQTQPLADDEQAQQGSQPQGEPPPAVSTSQPVIVINPIVPAPTPTFTPTPHPPAPNPVPLQPSVPPPASAPAPTAPAPAPAQSAYAPQVQAQGGEISGQASQPFYIVQPNDTLSQIASRFSTTVDALQKANNLSDVNSIWPGQLLYLPQSGDGQPGGLVPPPVDNSSQGALPSMPDTGINAGR